MLKKRDLSYRKELRVGRKRIKLPLFVPTVSATLSTWFWNYGIVHPAALIAYDSIISNRSFLKLVKKIGIKHAFSYYQKGIIIIDNGAYGKVKENKAKKIFQLQCDGRGDIAIILDVIPRANQSNQRAAVDTTVKNAEKISTLKREQKISILLEGVIQGITKSQYLWCAKKLGYLKLDIYGVGMTSFLKRKKYEQGVEKILLIKDKLPKKAVIHALGCGSRGYQAILSALGISIFDSFSYFYYSIYRRKLRPITLCSLGKPQGKRKCHRCFSEFKTENHHSLFKYNLQEILKENWRMQCAIRSNTVDDYLSVRLSKRYLKVWKNFRERICSQAEN